MFKYNQCSRKKCQTQSTCEMSMAYQNGMQAFHYAVYYIRGVVRFVKTWTVEDISSKRFE